MNEVINGLDLLGWAGCVTGLTGATLLALRWRHSAWGWVFFLISNVCWIAYAYVAETSHIEIQHLGFMATSLLGVYRWLWARPPQEERTPTAASTSKGSWL